VEARPGGAVYTRYHYEGNLVAWSTGKIPLTRYQRTQICAVANALPGTPYSFLDYAAIGLHAWRVPVPRLRAYIQSSGHLICSQLVDYAYKQAGVHLFEDNRWDGYVRPVDLATRLGV
jgi:cell wall-associated NlpC family hydrolase